jgi:hypothetical protein
VYTQLYEGYFTLKKVRNCSPEVWVNSQIFGGKFRKCIFPSKVEMNMRGTPCERSWEISHR